MVDLMRGAPRDRMWSLRVVSALPVARHERIRMDYGPAGSLGNLG